jgi:hypothetical protein
VTPRSTFPFLHTSRARILLVAIAAALSSCSDAPSSPSGADPSGTWLTFTSRPGEWVGGGRSRSFTAADTLFRAGVDCYENRIEISVGTFPDNWQLTMAAPLGSRLTTGTYEGAERYPFQRRGLPGLSFAGEGRGCNTLTGRFVVTEARFLESGGVRRYRATFEQSCDGRSPGVTGEVQLVQPEGRQAGC